MYIWSIISKLRRISIIIPKNNIFKSWALLHKGVLMLMQKPYELLTLLSVSTFSIKSEPFLLYSCILPCATCLVFSCVIIFLLWLLCALYQITRCFQLWFEFIKSWGENQIIFCYYICEILIFKSKHSDVYWGY